MSILFSRIGDGIDRLVEFTGDLASPLLEVFDAIMSVIVAALGLFLVVMHEFSLGLLTYTPYPGESEETSSQYIFGIPEEGDIFYTIITFNNNFIEPFALLMVFTGIIFLLFLRIFDIVIDDIGINTQEGMKRLFIAPIMIVLWIPIANLILYFAFGMTEWLTSLTLPGMEEIMEDDSAVDYDTDEDGSGSELGVMSYVELFERDEDAALGVFTSLIFIMYGAAAIFVSAFIYLFVMIGAFLRVLGVFGFYALAPIGIVLWSFKWRDFAKIGGTIIRYFILLAIFPIGVAFINLMAPPLLMAVQLASEDIIAEITDFTWNNPVHEGSINMTDVISNEEVMGIAFIIMTPILVGIIPWGIVIGFDKAIKMGVGAAGVAGAGALAVGTGGLGLGALGLANADNIAKAGASAAGSAKNRAAKALPSSREQMTNQFGSAVNSVGDNLNDGINNRISRYDSKSALSNRATGMRKYLESKGEGAVEMKDSWINKRDSMNESLFGAKDRVSNALERTNRTEMEKAFAESSFVSHRLGKTGSLAQDLSKAHLKGEHFLHSQEARTALAQDEREHGEGGLMTDSMGEEIDEVNEEEEFIKMYEEKALGEQFSDNEDLKEKYMDYKYRTTGLAAFSPEHRDEHMDDVSEDEMVHTFMESLQSDSEMNTEDVFGVRGAEKAKDTFKKLNYDDVEKAMIGTNNTSHAEFYSENFDKIEQIKKEKYGDKLDDTLLEREYRKMLYDESEQYINELDDAVTQSISESIKQTDSEKTKGIFRDAIGGDNPSLDDGLENVVNDILDYGGIEEAAKSEYSSVNSNLSDTEIKELESEMQGLIMDSVDLDTNTGSITLDSTDISAKVDAVEFDSKSVQEQFEVIMNEASKSFNGNGISINGDDLKGEAQDYAAKRVNALEEVEREQIEQIQNLFEQTQTEAGETMMQSIEDDVNQLQRYIEEQNISIDIDSEYSGIDDIIPNDAPDEIQNISDNLSNEFENIIQNASDRTGSDPRVDYDADKAAKSVIDTFAQEVATINERQLENIQRGIDENMEQARDVLSDSVSDHLDRYNDTEDSLSNYISSIDDDKERREVVSELTRNFN